MKTLLLLALPALATACASETERASEPPPAAGATEVGAALSAHRALLGVLGAIDSVSGAGREIRLRRVSSRFQAPTGAAPARVEVRLDLDFLAADDVEATRLHDALVEALRARADCRAVHSQSSRPLAAGIACDGFEVELGGASTPLTPPAGSALEAFRVAARRADVAVGPLEVRQRAWNPAAGIAWFTYNLRPSVRPGSFELDSILALARAIEEDAATLVTGIELRPPAPVKPGAAAVEAWGFELEATAPAGA